MKKRLSIPGLTPHAAILLWLLLAMLNPSSAAAANVAAADLVPAIEEALAAKGAPANARVTLADPAQIAVVGADGAPQFDAVSFNARSGRFLIRVKAAEGARESVIAGVARAPVVAPALIGPVARGEEISPENVAVVETFELAPEETPLDVADVEGMLARRALPAGAILRKSDLVAETLVKKGSIVAVNYERPGLRLSQQGVARSAGGKGDVIDVEIAGGKTLRAVVTGPASAAVVGPRLASSEKE